MPIGNLIVVGAIVAVFLVFMLVLGAVAWWSEQTPKLRRVVAKPAAYPAHGGSRKDFAGLQAR